MQKSKFILGGFLAMAVSLVMMAGCVSGDNEVQNENNNSEAVENEGSANANAIADIIAATDFVVGEFSHSDGLDDNGFWQGVTALNYVEIFNHSAMPIPREIHHVSDDVVQAEVDGILSFFVGSRQVTDRAVEDGDTINIDFVGSIDGVEFDGGSTNGQGMDVTIGVTQFIDDFLYQLIGGMPGDVINVEVTFPNDYHVPELAGEPALFVTTINYISEPEESVLSDEFVAENLLMFYGWATVAEMNEAIAEHFRESAVMQYLVEYLTTSVTIHSIPAIIVEYQGNSMIENFRAGAEQSGIEFDEFIDLTMEASNVEELIEMHIRDIEREAVRSLVIQAIAEDAGILVSVDDVTEYFVNNVGTDDFSMYEEMYGLPFLKMIVLSDLVFAHLKENAVLE